MTLSDNDGLIVFQQSWLPSIYFSFKFSKYFFLDFLKNETENMQLFLCFVYKILLPTSYF